MPDRKAVLIVEDEADMRVLIRVTLARDPRIEIVGEASTAEEAIAAAETGGPGAIVLDHSIDGAMTGLEAAPALKAAAPGSKIILFTAYDMAAEARREPAIDAFLRKDDLGHLLHTVEDMLGLGRTA